MGSTNSGNGDGAWLARYFPLIACLSKLVQGLFKPTCLRFWDLKACLSKPFRVFEVFGPEWAPGHPNEFCRISYAAVMFKIDDEIGPAKKKKTGETLRDSF